MAYLKSGTGQLDKYKKGPSVWPIQVKASAQQAIQRGVNENDACLAFVQHRLQEFNNRIQEYQTELDICKNHLQDDRETIYQTIETFIHKNLESLRQKIQHKIVLIQYDYNDRILELEFFQQNPNEACIKLYKHLYEVKYKQDITREEVQLVKKRISHYNNASKSSQVHFSHPPFLNTITNQDFQQQLYNQLTNAVKQAKDDMLNLCIKTAETQMEHYDKQCNKELDKFFTEEKSLFVNQQLTPAMFKLLEKRADNRKERIKYINRFKIHCLHSNFNY